MRTPDYSIPLSENSELQDYLVSYAVSQFNRLDRGLLDVSVSAECMCARVAFYIQFWMWVKRIEGYSVDVQYNWGERNLDGTAKKPIMKPLCLDLVVHKRGDVATGEGFTNVICIKLRKPGDRGAFRADAKRLQKLTEPDRDIHYCVAYMLHAVDKGSKKILTVKRTFRGGEVSQIIEAIG